jgi:hypothetical protein
VSVLRNRIVQQAAGAGSSHPAGTAATPMVMPIALVDYGANGATYQDLHAATGDVNAVPMGVVAPGTFGTVAPAGRP